MVTGAELMTFTVITGSNGSQGLIRATQGHMNSASYAKLCEMDLSNHNTFPVAIDATDSRLKRKTADLVVEVSDTSDAILVRLLLKAADALTVQFSAENIWRSFFPDEDEGNWTLHLKFQLFQNYVYDVFILATRKAE